MSANSKIEWTDHTFNPWIGCTKVSPACDHCYAEVSTPSRTLGVVWGAGQPRRRTSPGNWAMPLRWDAQATAFAAQHGRRQRVFCASLADVFDNEVPDEWRADLFALIEATPNLDWLLLTKRIGNAEHMMFTARGGHLPLLPNLWLGATICNQAEADRDIPKLLKVPARVRFLSMEPLLGPVNLHPWLCAHGDASKPEQKFSAWCSPANSLHWVIVGGESGHEARPMHPDWVRSLRDQCAAAGVPFLFKQWGEWGPLPEAAMVGDAPVGHFAQGQFCAGSIVLGGSADGLMQRIGKKAAGRLLDGVQHDGSPA
jgi:protein gp37